MKISPEETKRVRKTLLLNLVAGDTVLLAGLVLNLNGGHKWQTVSFLLLVLGSAWVVMTVLKMVKFRRFLRSR